MSPTRATRQALIVAGMHRSGTSAFTRVLGLLGADLPSVLMPPAPKNNETGFWEPLDIVTIHDELLAALGSSWDDVSPLPAGWTESRAAVECRQRILEILRRDFSRSPLFVLKDARICRLMPLWLDLLRRFRAKPLFVIPVRNPLEVAASLEARDGFVLEKSVLLWLWHLLEAEKRSRRYRRCFVRYEDLLRDWRATLTEVDRELGLSLDLSDATRAAEIDAFLRPGLRHHSFGPRDVDEHPDVVDWAKRAYRALCEPGVDSAALARELDRIRARLATADRAFGRVVTAASRRAVEAESALSVSESARRAADAAVADAEAARGEALAKLEGVQRSAKEAGDRHEELVAEMRTLLGELQYHRRALAERKEEITAFIAREASQRKGLEETKREVARLSDALRSAREERDAAVREAAETTGFLNAATHEREIVDEALARQREDRDRVAAEAETLARRLEAARRQEQQLVRELAAAREEAQRFQGWARSQAEQLRGLLASRSWRLTRPLRAVHDLLARGGGWEPTLIAELPQAATTSSLRTLRPSLAGPSARVGTETLESDDPDVRDVLASGLFDEQYFLAQPGAPGPLPCSPVEHYLSQDARALPRPNPLFDAAFYLDRNPDVVAEELNPLLHYVRYGAAEGRDPHPLFDGAFYARNYPDVIAAGLNPLGHFLACGADQGYRPFGSERALSLIEPYVRDPEPSGSLDHLRTPATGERSVRIGVYASNRGNYFFNEIQRTLVAALTRAGTEAVALDEKVEPPAELTHHVVVAPHEFFLLAEDLPADHPTREGAVVFNTEQIQTQWFAASLPHLARASRVLDISPQVAGALRDAGMDAHFLPVGRVAGMSGHGERLELPDIPRLESLPEEVRDWTGDPESPSGERPLDLLLVASLSPRREEAIGSLGGTFTRYRSFFHLCYPHAPLVEGETDLTAEAVLALSQRAKILLNIHQGELAYFEWHRIVMQGILQKTLVVTEPSFTIPHLRAGEHFIECELDEIPATLARLLETPEGLREADEMRRRAFETVSREYDLVEIMRRVVANLLP